MTSYIETDVSGLRHYDTKCQQDYDKYAAQLAHIYNVQLHWSVKIIWCCLLLSSHRPGLHPEKQKQSPRPH